MPKFSCFTRFGLLRFSSQPSRGKVFYDTLVASYRDPETGTAAIDTSPGTHMEATLYARAMSFAAAEASLLRVENQADPYKAFDARRELEKQYGVKLPPSTSMGVRREELAYRMSRNRGSVRENVEDGLRRILGDDFVAFRVLDGGEVTKWPASPGLGPGTFPKASRPAKRIRLLDDIATVGEQEVAYENWSPVDPEVLMAKGDVICVGPENLGLAEKVVVTSTSGTGTARKLRATFVNAHDAGSSATTGPAPIWWSTRRWVFVVAKSAAAVSPTTRRRIFEFCRRALRCTARPFIVQPTSPGASTIGPFLLAQSPLGVVPVGTFSL